MGKMLKKMTLEKKEKRQLKRNRRKRIKRRKEKTIIKQTEQKKETSYEDSFRKAKLSYTKKWLSNFLILPALFFLTAYVCLITESIWIFVVSAFLFGSLLKLHYDARIKPSSIFISSYEEAAAEMQKYSIVGIVITASLSFIACL